MTQREQLEVQGEARYVRRDAAGTVHVRPNGRRSLLGDRPASTIRDTGGPWSGRPRRPSASLMTRHVPRMAGWDRVASVQGAMYVSPACGPSSRCARSNGSRVPSATIGWSARWARSPWPSGPACSAAIARRSTPGRSGWARRSPSGPSIWWGSRPTGWGSRISSMPPSRAPLPSGGSWAITRLSTWPLGRGPRTVQARRWSPMAQTADAVLEHLRCRACGDIQWRWDDAAVIGDLDRAKPRVGLLRGDGQHSDAGWWRCLCGAEPAGRRQAAALRRLWDSSRT